MKFYDIMNNYKKYSGYSCVYCWLNIYNFKIYVGSTINLYGRFHKFKEGCFNKFMKEDVDKFGVDGFQIYILHKENNKDKLLKIEQHYIDIFNTRNRECGYNIIHADTKDERYRECFIGELNPMFGTKWNDNRRKAHSEFLKDKWKKDKGYREFWHNKMSGENNRFYNVHMTGELNPMFGKHHSSETKMKISEKAKGRTIGNGKVIKCVETGKIYQSQYKASIDLGCSISTISKMVKDYNYSYKGYHFILLKDNTNKKQK